MSILVDGDGCPNIAEIKNVAIQYQQEMVVFMDYAHLIEDDYFETVICDIGRDSVDLVLLKYLKFNDLVITQDYGLASLALLKGAQVLHVSGKIINHENIDQLLMSRFVSAKLRNSGTRLKGPPKRTLDVKKVFIEQLIKIIDKK